MLIEPMKIAFWGQITMHVMAILLIAMVVVPLAFMLVALWADKHRRRLFHQGQSVVATRDASALGDCTLEAA